MIYSSFSRKMKYKYRPGTTPVLTEKVVPLKLEVVTETVQQMDTAWTTTHNLCATCALQKENAFNCITLLFTRIWI